LVRLEFLEFLGEKARLLVMKDSPSYVWEALRMLGLDDENIIQQEADTVYTADCWISGNFGMNFIPERFKWLRDKLSDSENARKKKLFVERKAGLPRSPNSPTSLSECFSKQEFKVVRTEEYSLSDQVEMSTSADMIAGIHGAGLTNLLWNHQPSLMEIRPRGYDNRCYLHLALCCGAKDFWLYEEDHSSDQMILQINQKRLTKALETL
jgi:capsular polysaccharide biosynthesis protein